jgi:hypothetical protein
MSYSVGKRIWEDPNVSSHNYCWLSHSRNTRIVVPLRIIIMASRFLMHNLYLVNYGLCALKTTRCSYKVTGGLTPDNSPLLPNVQTSCKAHTSSYPTATGAIISGPKQPGRETNHSYTSSAEIKSECSYMTVSRSMETERNYKQNKDVHYV